MNRISARTAAAPICSPLRGGDRTDFPLATSGAARPFNLHIQVPRYLATHYWWAYIHPKAVRFFERQWLINLILWGNYNRLRNAVLADMAQSLSGQSLQVACAYGDMTTYLLHDIDRSGGSLDVVDVLPIQLQNLQQKLPRTSAVRLLVMDSSSLRLPDASYDQALVFFLLHEQPDHYRERTMSELFRVVKPGGKIIVVDYALPHFWHPLRYLWPPLLAKLEPFALDLWRDEIANWLPSTRRGSLRKTTFFGGLYQKVVITR